MRLEGACNLLRLSHLDAGRNFLARNGTSRTNGTVREYRSQKLCSGAKNLGGVLGFAKTRPRWCEMPDVVLMSRRLYHTIRTT